MSEIAAPSQTPARLFGRKALLAVTEFNSPQFVGDLALGPADRRALDLSNMHFRFETQQMDEQSPNACQIRVFNLKDETIKRIVDGFDGVVLQAGYQDGPYGTVFAGSIKQFGIGRESNVSNYLDIFAADGDIGYNFGIISATLAAGQDLREAINRAAKAVGADTVKLAPEIGAGQTSIRGKVLWGMARNVLRDAARSLDAMWSVQAGEVQFTPLTGYQAGDVVEMNSRTGLVGIPELTNDGVYLRCLLNPKIKVGGLIKVNNDEVNRRQQQNPKDLRQFNSWTDINRLAKVSADGVYQVFVAEHKGDTRGQAWWTELTCLSVDSSSKTVRPYG